MRTFASVVAASCVIFTASAGADVRVEKQRVATISTEMLEKGIVSQLTWDRGVLALQGAIPDAKGNLSPRYYTIAENGVDLTLLREPTAAMLEYWERKARRLSPTGIGKIVSSSDSQIALNALQGREQALQQSNEMGGLQTSYALRLGGLQIFKRAGIPPYDGQTYSWSPPALNRIAYTDANGDLWIAGADGRNATRLVKGNYTLPAWSDDGQVIAVAERKDGGRLWEVWIVRVPAEFRK